MKNEKICTECDNRRVIMGLDDEQDTVPVTCGACVNDWSTYELANGVGSEEINYEQE